MQDLFNFPKNEVIKTNEKLGFKASKKQKTKDLKTSTRDENFKVLIEELGGFPSEKQYFAIKTNGTSDCGSIFTYALNKWEVIEEAVKTGKLKKLTLVFSSTLKGANPALYASLVGALKPYESVKLKEINSHAKTFSITNGKDFITVSGSANWSENPRIENYLILNDKNLFEHHKDWMSELTDLV